MTRSASNPIAMIWSDTITRMTVLVVIRPPLSTMSNTNFAIDPTNSVPPSGRKTRSGLKVMTIRMTCCT